MLEKTARAIKNGQSRDNGNTGHTRHRTNTKPQGQSRMDNQETMATLGTQDTGPTQIKHKIEHVQHRQLKRRVTRTSPHNQV